MVSAKEEPDSSLPPAMDGLLRVHKRIIDGLEGDSSSAPPSNGAKVSTRLLVPASQAGSLIGKQGGTVKSIQEASACIVRVLGAGSPFPPSYKCFIICSVELCYRYLFASVDT